MENSKTVVMSYCTAEEIRQVRRVETDQDGSTRPRWTVASSKKGEGKLEFAVSSDVFGIAKSRRPNSFGQLGFGVGDRPGLSPQQDRNAPGTMYGQDRVGVEDIFEAGVVGAKLLWVNDGHGNIGERSAAEVASHLLTLYSMPGKIAEIREAIEKKNSEQVQRIIEAMWFSTAAHIRKKLGNNEGGTTCSHALIIAVGSQQYVITSNMGDSPVVIIDTQEGTVLETHGVHNWDNLEEYRLYDKKCQACGVPTSKAVYNRFNCGNGQLPGPNGDCAPVSIFKRSVETGLMEVDDVNLEYITNVMAGWGAIGGFQSEARMVMEDEMTGEVKQPMAGYGHTNWGSVVLLEDGRSHEGGAQCTRSFADWQEQELAHTIGDTPTVNVTAVASNAVVLVMSDGAADVIGYMHLFGQKVKEICKQAKQQEHFTEHTIAADVVGVDASLIVQSLGQWILERAAVTPNYGTKGGKPTWDDVTIAGATFLGHVIPESEGTSRMDGDIDVEMNLKTFEKSFTPRRSSPSPCPSLTDSCRSSFLLAHSSSNCSDHMHLSHPRISF